jgi:hypothetical protein
MLASARRSPPPKSPSRPPPPTTSTRNKNENGRELSGNDNDVNPSSENPLLKRSWKQRWGLEPTTEQLAELQARHLKKASEILLERLFAYLSKLPEEKNPEGDDDEDGEGKTSPKSKRRSRSATLHTIGGKHYSGGAQRNPMAGITLPASAVGWLSSQLCQQELQQHRKRRGGRHNRSHNNHRHPHDDNNNNMDNEDDDLLSPEDDEASSSSFFEQQEQVLWMGVTMRDRLKLLKFLLPRATHIRITRDVWPPHEMDDDTSSGNRRMNQNQAATTSNIHVVAAASGGGRRNPKATNPNPYGTMDGGGPLSGQDLNCSTISVNSTLTTESMRPRRPTMEAFLRYSHNLQHHPRIDIQRIFPNVQVLVLKEVPPTWIHNLHGVRHSLQVLRVERGSLYNVHGFLFPKLPSAGTGTRVKSKDNNEAVNSTRGTEQEEDPLAAPLPQGEEETNFAWEEYRSLSHLKLSHCGIGEVSGILGSSSNNNRENRIVIPPPLSRLPNLVSLSLSHNELRSERCALAGLAALPYLTKLDLSYNCLLG